MYKNLDLIYKELFTETQAKNIFVFVSGVEHIGTSWCALSMAHALSLKKKKVLLIDGNGNLSNISSYIPLISPLYIEEYILGQKTLNQLILAYKTINFNILTASPGNNYLEKLQQGRIQIFINDLQIIAKNYDYVIIDAGTDIDEKNVAFCKIAHSLFVMSSEKSSDLVKTFDILQNIHKLEISGDCKLIINRVNSFEDGYKIYKELTRAISRSGLKEIDLLGIVRFDTRIRDTIKNKELLLTRYPSSEAAVDICHMAEKIDLESTHD